MPVLSRRARKRRLRTAVAVIAVIVAAELGAQLLAPPLEPVPLQWPNGTTELKHEQLELLRGSKVDNTHIPIVFVGDSAAQQAFLPATFAAIDEDNRLSYNAAIPGGVPAVTRQWLLNEVIPRLESDVVVWGLGLSDVASDHGQDEIVAYEESLGAKDGLWANVERTAAEVSALVRLRPALRDPSLLFGDRRDVVVEDVDTAEALLGPGGQRLGYTPGPGDIGEDEVERRLGAFSIDDSDVDDIADTIAKIRRRGKNVVLVELPTSPAVVEQLPDGDEDLSRFRQTLADVSELTATQVIRPIGPFTSEDFVDHVHLTEQAAEDVTTQIAAALPTLELATSAATFGDGSGLAQAVAQVGDTAAREALGSLTDTLDAMDISCNDPARWMERSLDVVSAMDVAAATIAAAEDEDSERFRSSILARQIANGVGGRVLLQAGCEPGPTVGSAPSVTDFDTRTARLVSSYERFDAALAPTGEPPSSRLWMHPDQMFHVDGLRGDAKAESPQAVAFFGPAQVRTGIDPTLFSELTGSPSVNLGMGRTTPEVAALWIPDALSITRPDLVVWGVSPTDLIASCGLEVRRTFYTASSDVRAELFDNLPWKPPSAAFDQILGPVDRDLYAITPTYERAYDAWEEDSRGLAVLRDTDDEAALNSELEVFRERVRLTEGAECEERFANMSTDVRTLVNSGVAVVIVGLPAHPDLLAIHPSGASGVLASFQRNIGGLVGAGATYVDLTEGFTEEHFSTTINMNEVGRQLITERLAEALD